MRFVLLAFVSSAFVFAACGGDEEEAYDTFQACYDDHKTVESLPADQAIATCCIEHKIGSAAKDTVCGNDAAACMTYLTANLTSTSASSADIMAGCTLYVSERGQ